MRAVAFLAITINLWACSDATRPNSLGPAVGTWIMTSLTPWPLDSVFRTLPTTFAGNPSAGFDSVVWESGSFLLRPDSSYLLTFTTVRWEPSGPVPQPLVSSGHFGARPGVHNPRPRDENSLWFTFADNPASFDGEFFLMSDGSMVMRIPDFESLNYPWVTDYFFERQ